jgi:hypothetical protein
MKKANKIKLFKALSKTFEFLTVFLTKSASVYVGLIEKVTDKTSELAIYFYNKYTEL